MNFKQNLIKYKQTILMSLSLLLTLAFFATWITNNPDLKTFAYSEIKMSGFGIFKGFHAIATTISQLLSAMDFKIVSKLIYLGYLIILFPILGIASLVLSGLRNKNALMGHGIHFISTFAITLITFIIIILFKDIRIMFFSILDFKLGFYLSLVLSGLGTGYFIFLKRK